MKFLYVFLFVLCSATLWSAPATTTSLYEKEPPVTAVEKADALIDAVDEVAAEYDREIQKVTELTARLTEMRSKNQVAATQIDELQALVDVHSARVKQLGERYTKVLLIAQKLKKDLEWSGTMNYVLGGTAVVAIVVAVAEGIALAIR